MDQLNEVKNWISQDKLSKAVEFLVEYTKNSDSENEAIALSRKFHSLNNLNLIDAELPENIRNGLSRLTVSLLEFVDKLSQENSGLDPELELDSMLRVEFYIRGNLQDLSENRKRLILEQIAITLDAGGSEFTLGLPRTGSIILPIEFSTRFAESIALFLKRQNPKYGDVYKIEYVFIRIGRRLYFRNKGITYLSSYNFEGLDLRYSNLEKADLEKANFRNANLNYVNLKRASLRSANLENAKLRGADIWGADLRDAKLKGADLSFAQKLLIYLNLPNLKYAILKNINFKLPDIGLRNNRVRQRQRLLSGKVQELTSHIRSSISRGDTSRAIRLLMKYGNILEEYGYVEEGAMINDRAILLLGRYSNLEKSQRAGMMDPELYKSELVVVRDAILQILDEASF